MSALAPRAPSLLREWMEWTGPRLRCTPCADIFFVHTSRLLQAEMIQRPSFYAFWPQYYVSPFSRSSAGDSGRASASMVLWPEDGDDARGRGGGAAQSFLAQECRDLVVFQAGLGKRACLGVLG